MLILSRKSNEEIRINDNVVIKIISISDNQVKIGIEAPKSVEILRGEIFQKAREVTIEASQSSSHKVEGLANLKLNKIGASKK